MGRACARDRSACAAAGGLPLAGPEAAAGNVERELSQPQARRGGGRRGCEGRGPAVTRRAGPARGLRAPRASGTRAGPVRSTAGPEPGAVRLPRADPPGT